MSLALPDLELAPVIHGILRADEGTYLRRAKTGPEDAIRYPGREDWLVVWYGEGMARLSLEPDGTDDPSNRWVELDHNLNDLELTPDVLAMGMAALNAAMRHAVRDIGCIGIMQHLDPSDQYAETLAQAVRMECRVRDNTGNEWHIAASEL